MADIATNGQQNDQPKPEDTASTPPQSADSANAKLANGEAKPAEAKEAKTAPETPAEQPAEAVPAEAAPENNAEAPAAAEEAAANPSEADKAIPPTPPSKPASKRVLFIIGGLFIIGISALSAFFLSGGSQQPKPSETNATVNNDVIQPTLIPQTNDTTKSDINNPQAFASTFVYGAWSGQTTLIKAVELSTQKTTVLASLPSSIKKVSVLSTQTILYIDKTDKKDHGTQLVIYNIKTKAPLGSIPASEGFGIDDYVLSPDKKFLAIWEVSFAPNMEILQGGRSRVYAVDLTRPTVKKLLYDEKAGPTAPVHYPRAILNNGRVFADKFLPNDPKGGAGWAYGLSVIDFDGTNKQDIPSMMAGSYGTQPSLSPDGKVLLFSGYDGSKGDGKAATNGYRQALLTPNTVEILDTETLTRRRFAKFENTNTYPSAEWDPSNGKIVLTILSPNAATTGVYSYDMNSQELNKINVPATETSTYGFLTQLTPNTSIIGTKDTTPSNLGNLGYSYSYPFTQVALYDLSSSKVSFVPLEDPFAQYVTILPGDYFKSVLGIKANAQELPRPTFVDLYSDKSNSTARQQLYTFMMKYDLADTREAQQSTSTTATSAPSSSSSIPSGSGTGYDKDAPRCRALAEEQCQSQGVSEQSSDYLKCVKTNKWSNQMQIGSGVCSDSPLYLYGPAGKHIAISIQTPISNAIPYTHDGSYDVELGNNGDMSINGSTYTSIAYDYVSNAKKITPPARGAIVKKADVGKVLQEFAAKLGLNKKETADLVLAGNAKTTSDYVFVSFFDQETSKNILPISFNPEPDNYYNIVFYFKNLATKPNYTTVPPIFPAAIQRNGFTAVEISELAE